MATKPAEQQTPPEEQEEELIPVETPLSEDDEEEDEDGDEDEDEAEDDRLGEDEEDNDVDPKTLANRKRRQKRREMQKRAKEQTVAELEQIKREKQELQERLARVEGRMNQNDLTTLDQRISQTQHEIKQAEFIIGKATEAGNGDDAVAAMRIRDEARDRLNTLKNGKSEYEKSTQQPQQNAPQVDPVVASFAQKWISANPWYNPQGTDPDSAATKQIDAQLTREGFDPRSRAYWEELTERVSAVVEDDPEPRSRPAARTGKRNAPPTGAPREHAPKSTRRQIYVTPERRAAMEEAGVWDDPVSRQRYLRAYRDYDADNSAR